MTERDLGLDWLFRWVVSALTVELVEVLLETALLNVEVAANVACLKLLAGFRLLLRPVVPVVGSSGTWAFHRESRLRLSRLS